MSITVYIEITDYLPSTFNWDGFSINFKSDDKTFDENINYSQRNPITYVHNNPRKDIKLSIKAYKNGLPVGVTDFNIGQLSIVKREENVYKSTTIIMPDSVRKSLFNNYMNSQLKIGIRAKLAYTDLELRSSSAKVINTNNQEKEGRSSSVKASNGSVFKEITVPSNIFKKVANGLRSRHSEKNEDIREFVDEVDSLIDPLFEDDKTTNLDTDNLTQNISEFNKMAEEFEVSEDIEQSKNNSKEILKKLFTIQDIYNNEFSKAITVNKELRNLSLSYNEKFRMITKKGNKIKESFESNSIKSSICLNNNREENNRIKEKVDLLTKELQLYKTLFKLKYSDSDIENYVQEKKNEDIEKEKKLLLKIMENLYKKNVSDTLSDEKKELLDSLVVKFDFKTEEEIISDNVNKIVLDGDEDEEEIYENREESLPERLNDNYNTDIPKRANKRLTLVESNIEDVVDRKLDDYLNGFYAKKRMSQIPFRRLSAGNYEYGSQKIHVKLEGETIRVRVGGGYILIDKYMEINAPLEEAKIVKAQNVADKYKSNAGYKKVMGTDKNVYEIDGGKMAVAMTSPGKKINKKK